MDKVRSYRRINKEEWRQLLIALGMPQEPSGVIFGQSGRAGQRWVEEGGTDIPLCVEVCARLMLKHGIDNPVDLLKIPRVKK
jgi:hypothetical protein